MVGLTALHPSRGSGLPRADGDEHWLSSFKAPTIFAAVTLNLSSRSGRLVIMEEVAWLLTFVDDHDGDAVATVIRSQGSWQQLSSHNRQRDAKKDE